VCGGAHPAPALLEAFLHGRLAPAARREVAFHLRVCRACAEDLAPTAVALFAPLPPMAPAPAARGGEYDFPIFRACAEALRHAEALGAARRALGLPASGRSPAVPAVLASSAPPDRGLRGWARAEACLDAARRLRRRDPQRMLLLARLAVELAAALDPSRCGGPAAHADLQARALAELGNAYRIANDLARAEGTFARALALAARGSRDPLVLAELADRAASLFAARRRFAEAFRLDDAVHDIHRSLGDPHLAGRALVSKGLHAGYAGYPEQALELLSAGLREIDAGRDPALLASAIHNLLLFSIDCGRYLSARRLLAEARRLSATYEEPLAALRLRGLEGRIAFGLGNLAGAERAFDEVRRGFLDHGLPYTAAVVSLDLLAIWLDQGRTVEIRALVEELLAVFRAYDIRREAIATLLVLRRAVEREQATRGLLRTVAARLERLERGPARPGRERR
jgi:tetratricopeptide (TPR) repeat protein